jgi:triacylglycerol lipase
LTGPAPRATLRIVRRILASLSLVACGVPAEGAPAGGEGDGGGGSSGAEIPVAGSSEAGSATTGDVAAEGPYPIVLAHGFFGFDDFAGAGVVDYFWGVREHLQSIGEPQVFTPEVDPFNDSTTRGRQLLARIEAILAETGASKVNIIGHSQGGLDARVVANLRPDLVASVTTIATPHGGTPLADAFLLAVPTDGVAGAIDAIVALLGAPLWNAIGADTSLVESMRQFSADGIAEFNATYPDAAGVRYFSIAGRSDRSDGGPDCGVAAPPFIAVYDGTIDPIDPLFALPEALVDGGLFEEVPNDGLVRVKDSMWGEFLGCIPADHVDQIGHLFGDEPGGSNLYDHRVFFTALTAHLRDQGV